MYNPIPDDIELSVRVFINSSNNSKIECTEFAIISNVFKLTTADSDEINIYNFSTGSWCGNGGYPYGLNTETSQDVYVSSIYFVDDGGSFPYSTNPDIIAWLEYNGTLTKNKKINKVIVNGVTSIDLTDDQITSPAAEWGTIFHKADGEMAMGSLDYATLTPVATKGTVTNHSIEITPSVNPTEDGYVIANQPYYGSPVTVSASELVSGTISTITTSQTDVTNYQYASAPAGTAGTPTATKGTVSNHSISVTPSVTNTTGYITGSTKTGTAVTVAASELVSGTKNLTNTSVTDVTNYANAQVVDANLIAANIKNGTTILGVTGTMSGGIDLVGTSTTYTVNNDTDIDEGNFVSVASYVKEAYEGTQTGLSGLDEPTFCQISDNMYFGFSFSSKTALYTYFVQTDSTGIKSLKYATTTITSFSRYNDAYSRTYIHKLSSTKAIGIITTYAASTTYPNVATIIVFNLTVGSTPAASSCSVGSQQMIAKPSWVPGIPSAAFYDVSDGVNIAIFEPYRSGTDGHSRLHLYYASTSGTLTFEKTAVDSDTPAIQTGQGCAAAWIDGRRLVVMGPNNQSGYISYTSSHPLIVKEVDLKTDVQSDWSIYTTSFTNISYTLKTSGSDSVAYYLSAAYFNNVLHVVSCHTNYVYYLDLQRTGVETYTQVGLDYALMNNSSYTQNGIVPMQSGKTFVINYSTNNGGGNYIVTSPTTSLQSNSTLVAKYNGFLRDVNGFLLIINNYAFGFCQIVPAGQSGNILLPIKVLINPSTEAAQLQYTRSKSGDVIRGVCTDKTVTTTTTTVSYDQLLDPEGIVNYSPDGEIYATLDDAATHTYSLLGSDPMMSDSYDCNAQADNLYTSFITGHVYLFTAEIKASVNSGIYPFTIYSGFYNYNTYTSNMVQINNDATYHQVNIIDTFTNDSQFFVTYGSDMCSEFELYFRAPMLFDLTALYGAGNEPASVAAFKQDYPNAYYSYGNHSETITTTTTTATIVEPPSSY